MKGSTFKRKKNNAEQIKTAVEIMKKSELNLISNGIKSCLVESTIRFSYFFVFVSAKNGICSMLISVSSTWLCVSSIYYTNGISFVSAISIYNISIDQQNCDRAKWIERMLWPNLVQAVIASWVRIKQKK